MVSQPRQGPISAGSAQKELTRNKVGILPRPINVKRSYNATSIIITANAARDSKPRPVRHCRVLPPGEFTGIFTESLSIYPESFMKLFYCNVAMTTSVVNKHSRSKQIPHWL